VRALYGLTLCHYNRAHLAIAHATGSEFLALAERGGDPTALLKAHETLGYVSFALGRPTAARSHLEAAARLAKTLQQRTGRGSPLNPTTLVYLSWALLILGYREQAAQRCREGLNLAARSPDPFATAMGIGNAANFYTLCRDSASARREAESVIALARATDIPIWLTIGELHRGWALTEEGQLDTGLAAMRRASLDLGFDLQLPQSLAMLAETCRKARRTEEGLTLLAQTLEVVESTGERSLEAELHRLKGDLFLQRGADSEIEAKRCFCQAVTVARSQSARLWELRAATSLARLWRDLGQSSEGRSVLVPVYDWFTEGAETADLRDAKALLDELGR
jgi:predicted ATPase